MSENFIENLIEVGKLDATLTRMMMEKEMSTKQYSHINAELNRKAVILSGRSNLLKEKEAKYSVEEKRIGEERQKLVDRRKAIMSFNDFRTQQAAQKEIEFASKQLDAREESLFPLMEEIENLKKDYDRIVEECKALKTSFDALAKTRKEADDVFKKREEENLQKKDSIIKNLERSIFVEYNKAKNRNPMDPIVPVIGANLCGGCSMKLGSQVVVNIAKENFVVHCPGCNRILYIKKEDADKKE